MLNSLGLELQIVVSCHVGAGDQTQVLWKGSQYSKPWAHLSSSSGEKGRSFLDLLFFIFKGIVGQT